MPPVHKKQTAIVDSWTPVHMVMGAFFGAMGMKPRTFLTMLVVYEIGEQWFERTKYGQEFFGASGPEAPGNVAADMAANMGGYYLGRAVSEASDE